MNKLNNETIKALEERKEQLLHIEGRILTGKASMDKPWEKYYSGEVNNMQFPEMTMFECIYANNKNYLGRTAVEYYGRKITYSELFDNIEKAAKALKKNGIENGDIVTLCMPTTPEVIYIYYALNRIGAIANLVDPRTSEKGINHYIKEAKSNFVIYMDLFYDKIKKSILDTDVTKTVSISASDSLMFPMNALYQANEVIKFVVGKKVIIPQDSNNMRWNDFIKTGNDYIGKIDEEYKKDKPAAIVHTGGTTGVPKGVLLSNENFNAVAYQYKNSGMHLLPGQRFLNIMPPFISYGIGCGIHMPLVIGMTTIPVPSFDPKKFDQLVINLKPNHSAGVPTHLDSILTSKKMKNKDLSYWITPAIGGDGINLKSEEKANEFLRQHGCPNKVVKGYGITEECSLAAACINDINEFGSVGIPLPKNVVGIFEPDTDNELNYNEKGEICITGPTVMLKYFENEEETNKVLKKHKDGRVWVHTQDVGYLTENGFLYVEGRIKRMIIRHDGFKVFPFIIEKAIMSHAAVENCIVVSIPDTNHSQGFVPKAHIILKDEYKGNELTIKNEIIKICMSSLPEYALPSDYKFRDNFPYTPIGKIDYVTLQLEDSARTEIECDEQQSINQCRILK